MYDAQSEGVLAVLPHEVAEEDDDEVVVRADEAAEEADELVWANCTRMESISMSMRWSTWGSCNLLLFCILIVISMITINTYRLTHREFRHQNRNFTNYRKLAPNQTTSC